MEQEIMENQNIVTSTNPRVTFKRTNVFKKARWDIGSSSSKDKDELIKIVDMIEDVNVYMEKKFLVKKQ